MIKFRLRFGEKRNHAKRSKKYPNILGRFAKFKIIFIKVVVNDALKKTLFKKIPETPLKAK